MILQHRDYQQTSMTLGGVPELLQKINESTTKTTEYATSNNPTAITLEEYFDPEFDLKGRDIGRPKEVTIRTQKFKATLWMSEDFPLSLMEQVTPIIDLMARTSAHFARLRDFITLEFPPGFPVKIEIPLFHVLNARITFENVNGCRTADKTPALQESYLTSAGNSHCSTPSEPSSFEKDLQLAMELSVREQEEREKQRREEEDAELQKVLQLSLVEK
ncbi:ankyrin repeat domain-containing protein 13a [Limosa lapponica baueri]|uniref:Ankyrin repeat domain-containing protein 13a n=1 Tax=Limosa lapponica baueri TaxID=1758121 RepID=A0A2I0T7C8_LIMLA|nr:ankyrin repeat domain-containing protein 13a [Limosa lapponica baueri]